MLVFYLKILIGHPWNQGWSGFSSAKATSEVAQEIGQGERESDNLEERIQYFFKVLNGDETLTTNTSHFSFREKIAVKKKRIQKAGAATRPVQNIDTLHYIESRIWGVKKRHLGCWKPVLVLLCSALKDPGGLTLVVDVVPPPDLQFAHKFSLGFWQKTWVQQECDRSRSWRSRSRAREGGWWGRNFRWNCRRTNRREGKLDEGRKF